MNRNQSFKDDSKMNDLYDYIRADGNRTNQSMILNHSLNSKNSQQRNNDVYEMFKEDSF